LEAVKIDIIADSGFGYWFLMIGPFLIPLIFIGFFIWFLNGI
jgi:hypothetical protein